MVGPVAAHVHAQKHLTFPGEHFEIGCWQRLLTKLRARARQANEQYAPICSKQSVAPAPPRLNLKNICQRLALLMLPQFG